MTRKRIVLFISFVLLLFSAFTAAAFSASAADYTNAYSFYTSYCGTLNASGETVYSYAYQTTDFIAVKKGDTVYAGPFESDQQISFTLFDSNKSVVKQYSKLTGLTAVSKLSGGQYICSLKIDSDKVSSVRVTFKAEYYNTFLCTLNTAFDGTAYDTWIKDQGLTKYIDFINSDKSSFSSKTLLWCGDSVGNGSYEKYYDGAKRGGVTGQGYAFAARVSNLLNFKSYKNTSSGGATITTKYPSNRIFDKISKNASTDTEYLIIQGGVVDACGYKGVVVPVGYMSDSFSPATFAGRDTFIGALEYNFYLATTKSPNAVIVFVMCYKLYSSVNGANDWERIWQYVPAVCEKWGIPLINLYDNETVREIIEYDPKIAGFFYYDNLHCTPHGYVCTSLEIAMELQNIPQYSKENRKTPTNIPAAIAKDTWQKLDPGSSSITVTDPVNLFVKSKATAGKFSVSGATITTLTSDYISVKAGDTVYFGPCSPYETCALAGYDSNKKQSTDNLDSLSLTLEAALSSGYVLYSYTVPDNVSYVKATFTDNVTPVITLNTPLTADSYNQLLDVAVNGTSAVTTAAADTEASTSAPDETSAETAAITEEISTGEESTEAGTDTEETPEKKKGCASVAAPSAVMLMLFAGICFKKKRKL